MTLRTVFAYQVGSASAIRAAAESRAAIPTGIVLVLLTAIARNYDQSWIGDTLFWMLFGPLLFSFFSGGFLSAVLYAGFIRSSLPAEVKAGPDEYQYRSFMGLFWLTAPIAWLYALPVERWFDSYQAAQANLTLLLIVSAWRVLLMSRVISVLQGVPLLRTLGWVTLAAAIEVLVVGFVGGMASGQLTQRVMASMSGMRNSPEEVLQLHALSAALATAIYGGLAVLIALAVFRNRQPTRLFPQPKPDRIPWIGLTLLAIVWVWIAIPAQQEQQRFSHYNKLLEQKAYPEAIAYLSQLKPEQLPPGRRLPPDPFNKKVWDQLPDIFTALKGDEPAWIRERYYEALETVFTHHHYFERYANPEVFAPIFESLEHLPEGKAWVRAHIKDLPQLKEATRAGNFDGTMKLASERLSASLKRLGVNTDGW